MNSSLTRRASCPGKARLAATRPKAQAQFNAPPPESNPKRSTPGPSALKAVAAPPRPDILTSKREKAPTDIEYDAVIIGSGMGGLTTAARLVEKGAKVIVLEKYIIPGGSAGRFEKDGYIFDVGSSMMFGFGKEGETNLLTKVLTSVHKEMEVVPDPVQVQYHLPGNMDVTVWRKYGEYIDELSAKFPQEKEGIKKFYDECWVVFNALNSLELKSLEEPRYLLGQLVRAPMSCLNLLRYLTVNTGEMARKYIRDPTLLRFIDLECFIWSTVSADMTPFINTGMVFCDRHYGGIHYPKGGIGEIPRTLAEGIEDLGGRIEYKANVKEIVLEGEGADRRAVGVRLADGRVYRGKSVISNATRWDTFEGMIGEERLPESEKLFRQRYKKSPSFFTMHLGVRAEALPAGTFCHHILLEDWATMEEARSVLFVSIPTVLDPSLAPAGRHIIHAFVPDWIDNWSEMDNETYEKEKDKYAQELIRRLEARAFPGLSQHVEFIEAGTPRTHRRFLNRNDGTYGPIPAREPLGIISMPFNKTDIGGLYCVGDSTFPGQGVNAVVFSGFGCAHRVLVDQGKEPSIPGLDQGYNALLAFFRDRS